MFICPPVPSLLCCLLGNVCHSVLPSLAHPTLGRSQLSSDPKPILPFHLLPGFTDVSTVSHRSCHGNDALTYCTLLSFSKYQNTNRSLYQGRFLLQVEEFVTCNGVPAWTYFSIHRCTSALPTPFQIYHLWCRELWHFHTTWGVELVP